MERPVLAFLNRLVVALLARDPDEIRRLLQHPLAHALTRRVREEALAIAAGGAQGFRAPIHTLQLYHQTAHLLGAVSDPATRSAAGRGTDQAPAGPAHSPALDGGGAPTEATQIELPLLAPHDALGDGSATPSDDRSATAMARSGRRPTPRWVARRRALG